MRLGKFRICSYDNSMGLAIASPSTDIRHSTLSKSRLDELLRMKKRCLGVISPCMFSNRASRELLSCRMNGVVSLKKDGNPSDEVSWGVPSSGVTGGLECCQSPHAASTAAAPPADIRARKRRRVMPCALADSQSLRDSEDSIIFSSEPASYSNMKGLMH